MGNSWVVQNYPVHEPALAAVCNKCNVAGVSPDASLREKCIEAGVPAAPGTGRAEDFQKTQGNAPNGAKVDAPASSRQDRMPFSQVMLIVAAVVVGLFCISVLTFRNRA